MSFACLGILLSWQKFFAALESRLVLGKSFSQKEKRDRRMRAQG